MDIYWLDKQKRCGPATVPDVLSMIRLGDLHWDTLGWHSGCREWAPLHCLPALADFAEEGKASRKSEKAELTQPTVQQDEAAVSPSELSVYLPSPVTRFVARVIDCIIYATLALGALYAFGVPYRPYLLPGHPVFWLGMPVVEAVLLRIWGTTPGKRWMGIALTQAGQRGLAAMLGRSLCVHVFGMGCMVPFLMLITLPLSYFRVRRFKIARWDILIGAIPVSSSSVTPAIFIVVIPFILICMQLCSCFLLPWLPDMLQQMEEQNPQALQMMMQLLEK